MKDRPPYRCVVADLKDALRGEHPELYVVAGKSREVVLRLEAMDDVHPTASCWSGQNRMPSRPLLPDRDERRAIGRPLAVHDLAVSRNRTSRDCDVTAPLS
jgi:hypothetical protein